MDPAAAIRDSRARRRLGLLALFAVSLASFWPTLQSYQAVWEAEPWTYGYLIVLAAAAFVWRERRALRPRSRPWGPAMILAVGLTLLWVAAHVASTRTATQALVPVLMLFWGAAVFGPKAVPRLAPIAGVFLLGVPFRNTVSGVLQSMVVVVSGGAVRLFGIEAVIDGNVIHVESGSFLIADGCAGFNFLLAGVTVGALYAQGAFKRGGTQALVLTLAAVLPIVGNWIRVTGLILIGHETHMESIFLTRPGPHTAFGWGLFCLALVVFFWIGGRIERWEAGGRRPASDEETATLPATAPEPVPLRPAVGATSALVLGPALYLSIGMLPARPPDPFVVSGIAGDWRPAEIVSERPYPWRPAFQGADEQQTSAWRSGESTVLLDRLTYRTQAQGAELIGYPNVIAEDVLADRLLGSIGADRRLVNEAIVRDESAGILVWYWYRVGGIEAVDPVRAKLLEIVAFFRRASTSELIAVSTACAAESCAEASRTLMDFMAGT